MKDFPLKYGPEPDVSDDDNMDFACPHCAATIDVSYDQAKKAEFLSDFFWREVNNWCWDYVLLGRPLVRCPQCKSQLALIAGDFTFECECCGQETEREGLALVATMPPNIINWMRGTYAWFNTDFKMLAEMVERTLLPKPPLLAAMQEERT